MFIHSGNSSPLPLPGGRLRGRRGPFPKPGASSIVPFNNDILAENLHQ